MASTDLEILRQIDDLLNQSDEKTRQRILGWLNTKYSFFESPEPRKSKKKRSAKKPKVKTKTNHPTFAKNLNLRPKAGISFLEFAKSKAPDSIHEKNAVAVYFLEKELKAPADISGVYTCYKEVGWKLPSDVNLSLRRTASSHGFIDTSDTANIRMTVIGENLIEHTLPKMKAKP